MFRFPGPILVSASAALLSIAGAAYSANDGSRTVARPAAIDSLIQRTYRWRLIGPDKGGRSIGVSGVKGRPQEAYFGAVGGGLWKTTNGGADWVPVTDGQIGSTSVGVQRQAEHLRDPHPPDQSGHRLGGGVRVPRRA